MFNFRCKKDSKQDGCRTSSGLTKKQQAIADREIELIQLAKSLVQEQGFANLTMDKLTAASPYSKGTIYNHFCSKEDVILALCIHSLRSEAIFFERTAKFNGNTREKIIAMHVGYRIYARMEPVLSTCAIVAKTPWVLEKASPKRVNELNNLEEQVIDRLEQLGYKITPQVGYSGYRIDIGVIHPTDTSRYVLGIECDGATFHSAKSVRERDIMRQRFLEQRGWKIHRIWSRNWWQNPDYEIAKVKDRIDKLSELDFQIKLE